MHRPWLRHSCRVFGHARQCFYALAKRKGRVGKWFNPYLYISIYMCVDTCECTHLSTHVPCLFLFVTSAVGNVRWSGLFIICLFAPVSGIGYVGSLFIMFADPIYLSFFLLACACLCRAMKWKDCICIAGNLLMK